MSAFEPYEGNEPYIFISYARKNKDRVFSLLDTLHGLGYRIWRDEGGIPWGVKWMATIEDHLTRAAVCLVFWSEASAASEHCGAEAGEMVSERKPIVTVFLDDTPLTPGLRMYLQQFQTVKLADFDSDAVFVEHLAQQPIFAPCKAAPGEETPPVTAPTVEAPPTSKIAPTLERRTGEATVRPVPRIPTVPWNKNGKILWYLDRDGVLTIAKNEELSSDGPVLMPDYKWSSFHCLSTAPWMRSWEKIRSVVILNGIATIGDHAFAPCAGLTSVSIPDSVSSIGKWAFMRCAGLMSVTIPNGVTTIGAWAFSDCTGLTSVTIPDGVTSIGNHAFHGCTGLTSVTIPDGVTTIGDCAFSNCTSLTRVMIPDSMSSIGHHAFSDCTGLTSVTIPDRVTSVGYGAFFGCAGLTSVMIPAWAKFSYGNTAFPEHVKIIYRSLSGEIS